MPETKTAEELLYIEAIRQALLDEMDTDPSVYIMGQDVAAYGGAFKITKGFVDRYGPQRIFNTPIAEAGTIGIAAGSALLGRRPVVEMQFADFVSCGFNQLVNVAAKLYYRMERPVPLVVRLPAGGGVGAGAFHSQNMEAWFTHVPGLKVVAPSTSEDAYLLLRQAIRDPNPVLYFEHKFLYRRERGRFATGEDATVPDALTAETRVVLSGSDVTLITYGWMRHRAMEAAARLAGEGIEAEVLDLRVLSPLDMDPILESVAKTSRAVIVHEATTTSGFGAEIAARIADEGLAHLDAPIKRVAYPDEPVPFHKSLEAENLPTPDRIATTVHEVLAY